MTDTPTRPNETRETVEWFIQRVMIPLFGLAGVIYEELTNTPVSSQLILYAAMMGLGAPALPAVSSVFRSPKDKGGENQ